jgi:asparagine synthetase B (glutamine-hydrolysing)
VRNTRPLSSGDYAPGGCPRLGLVSLAIKDRISSKESESSDISLGATRLHIVDMDGGDRPLFSSDGGVVLLVFNGEVFNHAALRSEL